MNLENLTTEEMLESKPVSMPVKEEILKRHENFLWKMAWRMRHYYMANMYGDNDDWFQEAAIGLLKSMDGWIPGMGAKFLTYATNGVWMYLRGVARKRSCLIANPQTKDWFDRAIPVATLEPKYGDRKIDPASIVEQDSLEDEKIAALKVKLQWIDERERQVLEERFVNQNTFKVIGQKMGMTKQNVDRIEKQAIAKLRKLFSENEP